MKKLMFAAAAIAAGTALAVESQVVGYQQKETADSGTTFITPTFSGVGVTDEDGNPAMDILDVVPVSVDPDYTIPPEGQLVATVLDPAGFLDHTFDWWTDEGGWCLNGDVPPERGECLITAGDCFYLGSPSDKIKLQFAGQVITGVVISSLADSGTLGIGNPYPVAVDVLDIVPFSTDPDYVIPPEGQLVMTALDPAGFLDHTFDWWTDEGGWCLNGDVPPEEGAEMIEPGDGLYVGSPSDKIKLRWPGISLM